MKRMRYVMIMVLVILSFTGCMKEYDIPEDKSDAVAEYMAGLLLNSDDDYDQKLIDPYDMTEVSSSDNRDFQTPATADNTDKTDTQLSDGNNDIDTSYTLNEVIGNDTFTINYKSYKITDIFSDDSDDAYFVLTSRNGYELLAVSFDVMNTTKSTQHFSLNNKEISYQLRSDSSTVSEPLLTLLENDMQFIDLDIKAGKTIKGQLVFEIPQNTNTDNLNIMVAINNKAAVIDIN